MEASPSRPARWNPLSEAGAGGPIAPKAPVEGVDCPARDKLIQTVDMCLEALANLDKMKTKAVFTGAENLQILLDLQIEQAIVITNAALHALRWHRDTHRC